jgi:membrane-associated protease RseP (regulator of RpoE activity)
MKAPTKASRLASPAGFALVLLLFLVMPFLSASCDVPEAGSISADYTGARLAAGADAQVEIPKGLEDIADELLDVLDPGVRVLALVVALLLVAGVVLPFVPRLGHELRHRMFGGAALAVLAGALMVVTQVVAQANLTDRLTAYAEKLSQNEPVPNIDRIDELMHAEVGYWLSLIGLILIAGLSVGNVFKDKIVSRRPELAHATAAGAAPIWHAESPEPAEPPAPAPTEPPAPVGPAAPPEPPAPTGPEGPSEPAAPTERPGEPTP